MLTRDKNASNLISAGAPPQIPGKLKALPGFGEEDGKRDGRGG